MYIDVKIRMTREITKPSSGVYLVPGKLDFSRPCFWVRETFVPVSFYHKMKQSMGGLVLRDTL